MYDIQRQRARAVGFIPTGQSEISRPLGTVTFDMLVLALGEEGDWLKVHNLPAYVLVF